MDLYTAFLVALGCNLAMFVPAYIYKTDKLTDISYALTFILVAGWAFLSSGRTAPQALLAVLIIMWAVRLGGFLLYRVSKKGKDVRFDGMREDFFKFLRFWVLQGASVFVILLAALIYLREDNPAFNPAQLAGLLVMAAGILTETAADWQKWQFRKQAHQKNSWIQSGLWARSRHPNYFGELLVWVGVWFYGLPVLSYGDIALGMLSPLYIYVLLRFVSGVPPLEKAADKKWGNDPAYQAYKKKTPLLVPYLMR